ncbi:MAG: hypothetical protein ACO3TX_07365, partial [Pseudomonadales bacterium]
LKHPKVRRGARFDIIEDENFGIAHVLLNLIMGPQRVVRNQAHRRETRSFLGRLALQAVIKVMTTNGNILCYTC